MNLDEYQRAWNAEAAQTKVTIDADSLFEEVEQHQQDFRTTILWRDLREIVVSVTLIPVWIFMGVRSSSLWTWYLMIPALLWVAGFILVDRRRHPQKPIHPSEALIQSVSVSLTQVEHQIWLLRNVLWWYLLPIWTSLMAHSAHVSWLASPEWFDFSLLLFPPFFFFSCIYAFVYWINQRAVRTQLLPRRDELVSLLSSLDNELEEDTSSDANSYEITPASVSPFSQRTRHQSVYLAAQAAIILFLISILIVLPAIYVWSLSDQVTGQRYDQPSKSAGPAGDTLARLISDARTERELVSLAAMVMVDGQVKAVAANGERKIGSGVPIGLDDQWHIGGITKAVTATMIGRLVESGRMQWSDTVGTYFADPSVHADWKVVTLRQLLTDTAGSPPSFTAEVNRRHPSPGAELMTARREVVLDILKNKPVPSPGREYVYSNVGYTIVGVMAEKATGVSWEDLVKQEVFEPLALTGAGFGPPKSPTETLDQPRGHVIRSGRKYAVDDTVDNTPIMGPAATIRMTLSDLCVFANEHLDGERGEGKLLSTETYELLHAPELGNYACGWIKSEASVKTPKPLFWHNGSNTVWYAWVAFVPETNTVVAVTSNDGDIASAQAAAWEMMGTVSSSDGLVESGVLSRESSDR